MKEYYLERLHWIFKYTSKNFFYCIGKTLCLIVGIPIYAVMFAVEMVLTFVNMIFSIIPILNVVVGVICKSIIFLIDKTFFICILTDVGKWRAAHKKEVEYEVLDDLQPSEFADDEADNESTPEAPQKDSGDLPTDEADVNE